MYYSAQRARLRLRRSAAARHAFDDVRRVCCEPVKAAASAQVGSSQQTGRIQTGCSEVTSVVKKTKKQACPQKKKQRRRRGRVCSSKLISTSVTRRLRKVDFSSTEEDGNSPINVKKPHHLLILTSLTSKTWRKRLHPSWQELTSP